MSTKYIAIIVTQCTPSLDTARMQQFSSLLIYPLC